MLHLLQPKSLPYWEEKKLELLCIYYKLSRYYRICYQHFFSKIHIYHWKITHKSDSRWYVRWLSQCITPWFMRRMTTYFYFIFSVKRRLVFKFDTSYTELDTRSSSLIQFFYSYLVKYKNYSEAEIIEALSIVKISSFDLMSLYKKCVRDGHYEVAYYLVRNTALKNHFLFMQDHLHCFKQEEITKLVTIDIYLYEVTWVNLFAKYTPSGDIAVINAQDIVPIYANFDCLLKLIFGADRYIVYRKRVGQALLRYGTQLLNNLYFFSKVTDIHAVLDQLLNYDHTRFMYYDVTKVVLDTDHPANFDWLFEVYSLKTVFRLFTSFAEDVDDLCELVDNIKLLEGARANQVIKQYLRPHPRNFEDVLHYLLPLSYSVNEEMKKIELQQEIVFLHGMSLFEFTINVPQRGEDLISTGQELQLCVAIYIKRVVNRKCQIINLYLEQQLKYTLELQKKTGYYRVVQFKGRRNSSELEGEAGGKYRERLEYLINQQIP